MPALIRLLTLTFVLLVAGGPRTTLARQATPVVPAPTFRVADLQPVGFADGAALALSPDGRWLAVWRAASDEVCTYATVAREEPRCAVFPGGPIDAATLAWSPSSTHLAVTEDVVATQHEPDLWVLDVATGVFADLTDDGEEGRLSSTDVDLGRALVDMAPTWSPDGRELAFARSRTEPTGEAATALYRIPVGGGEPQRVAVVADRRYAVSGVWWSPEGTTIAYRTSYPVDSALWAIDAGGGTPRMIVEGDPRLLQVSAGGLALLITPPMQTSYDPLPFTVVDLATGDAVPNALADGAEAVALGAAAFSPDGTRALRWDLDGRLDVRDLATGQEQALLAADDPFADGSFAAMTWAANGLVFGQSGGAGWLVRLTPGWSGLAPTADGDAMPGPDDAGTPAAWVASDQGTAAAPVPLGAAATVGGWTVWVTAVATDAAPEDGSPAATGRTVLITLAVADRMGSETEPYVDLDWGAVGPSGRSYGWEDACPGELPGDLAAVRGVPDGGSTAGTICFDVQPEDADRLVLVLGTSVFDQEATSFALS